MFMLACCPPPKEATPLMIFTLKQQNRFYEQFFLHSWKKIAILHSIIILSHFATNWSLLTSQGRKEGSG